MTRAVLPHIISDDSSHSGKVIGGSLLFSNRHNDYLVRTPSSDGHKQKWTFSVWIKPTQILTGSQRTFFSAGSSSPDTIIKLDADRFEISRYSGSYQTRITSTKVLRDCNAWYHLVGAVDTTQASATNRVKMYVNGVQVTDFDNSSYPSQNFFYEFNSTSYNTYIGKHHDGQYFDGYLTEFNFVDGQQYNANHFGFFESSTGNWVPKSSEVIKANTSYGTNGFYLPFDGTDYIGTDKSGQNNNFRPNRSSMNAVHDLSKATGGLPIFKTNTGGTQKASFNDVREDPFKSYIEAAVPLVSGTRYDVRDYSADIKGSGTNKTCTASGTDVADRIIAFAGPSRYYDGNDDQVYIAQDSSFDIGTGDFCIECWYNAISYSSTGYYKRLWCLGNGIGDSILIDINYNNNRFEFRYNNTAVILDGGSDANSIAQTYVWQHVAMVRQSGTWKMYVDGRMIASTTTNGTADLDYNRSNHRLTIGRVSTTTDSSSVASSFNGYISDFRYYKGTCKYTGNFIPPKPIGEQSTGSYGGWVTPDTPSGTAVGRLPDNVRFTSGSVCFDGLGDSTASQSALSIADTGHMDFYFDADFTIECYFYRSYNPTTVGGLLGQWVSGGGTDRNVQIYINSNGTIGAYMNRGGTNYSVSTDEIKPGYWNHIAMVLQGSTLRLYINGKQTGTTTVSGSPNNATKPFFIGSEGNSSSQAVYSYSGLITNVRVVKGVAVYPDGTEFKPSTEPLTNITGTVLLCCQSRTSVTEAAVTPVAIQTHGTSNSKVAACNFNPFDELDTVSQESNYCILSDIDKSNNASLQEGSTYWSTSTGPGIARGSLSFSSGKYYYEVTNVSATRFHAGVIRTRGDIGADDIWHDNDMTAGNPGNEWAYRTDGYSTHNSGETQISPKNLQFNAQVLMVAIDADNDKVYFGRQGVWLNGANPELGTNPHYSNLSGTLTPALGRRSGTNFARANFGQRPFKFPPPVGYKTICSANIEAAGIVSKKHHGVVIYNGNGPTGQSITGLDFKPDLVWIKSRSFANNHHMFDILRGPDKILRTSTSDVETEVTDVMSSFDSNGFTVKEGGGNNATNANGQQLVAWCWKAGGAASSNSNGTITSSVSVNQEAGFSIVTWTGDGNVNSTVGHGLNGRPDFIMLKSRTYGANWRIYHNYYGTNATSGLYHVNGSTYAHDSWGGIKAITTTTFGFGTNGTNDLWGVNRSGINYVAYCWKAVEGYSSFGTYLGNGQSTQGPFVNLGFRPSLIIRKKISDVGDWLMMDTTRHPNNTVDNRMLWTSAQEQGSGNNIDIYANGFKERSSDGYSNANNAIMLYMAWGDRPAHTPFGIQNEAR